MLERQKQGIDHAKAKGKYKGRLTGCDGWWRISCKI